MNEPELSEDMQQYPIRPIRGSVEPAVITNSISINDITVLLPTMNPQTDEMNNMRFIINKLIDLKLKVIVVEQIKDQYSYLFKFIETIMISRGVNAKTLSHELYITNEKKFLKNQVIEWAIREKVKSRYVWVNNPNFYVNFSNIVQHLKNSHESELFLPCMLFGIASSEETKKLVDGENISSDHIKQSEDKNDDYSFIVERKTFLNFYEISENNILTFQETLRKEKLRITTFDERGIFLHNGPKIELLPRMEFSDNVFEKDMAIIVIHFNWCKYINPSRNLNRFLRQMDIERVPVYGVELSTNDSFETANRKNWIQMKVGIQNVCFQKEACINLVEKHIPEKYKKVAWIDPDLHFTNKNWYRETSEKLNTHKMVQMYSEGYGTDRYGRISRRHPSIMAMYKKVPMDYWFKHPGHPGGAWGAQREFWQNGGLYPYCIMGGGDTVFVYTVFDYTFKNDAYASLGLCEENMFEPYFEWKKKIKSYVGPEDITYVNNSFIHEWHGDSVNRSYNLRHNIVKTIDMTKNVRLNDSGIIELINIKKRSIYDGILGYFKGRDEDGVMGDMEAYINFKNQLNEQK